MLKLTYFVYFIFFIKICFIIFAVIDMYYVQKYKKTKDKTIFKKELKIHKIKARLELVFIILMSILLLIVFYPRRKTLNIDFEIKLLLFTFGIVLLITADWNSVIYESPALKYIQHILAASKRY